MDITDYSHKELGDKGEDLVAHALTKRGYRIIERNVRKKTGEIDIVASKDNTLHVIEVKTVKRSKFPQEYKVQKYNPAGNIHAKKIQRTLRTGQWIAAKLKWKGAMQMDAALVYVRTRDGHARIEFITNVG